MYQQCHGDYVREVYEERRSLSHWFTLRFDDGLATMPRAESSSSRTPMVSVAAGRHLADTHAAVHPKIALTRKDNDEVIFLPPNSLEAWLGA